MKVMFGQVKSSHLLVSDFNASGIISGIEIRGNRQPRAGGRIRDQIHHHAIAA